MINGRNWMMTQKVKATQLRVLNSVYIYIYIYIFQIHIAQVRDC
jgi:hypothetical protein